MKIISVVGPTQSGSTMLFNLLRFLFERDYTVFSCWTNDYKAGNYEQCDILIVKCHRYHQKLAQDSELIFLPIRDFRDAAISRAKRKGFKEEKFKIFSLKWRMNHFRKLIKDNIEKFNSWKPEASFVLKYEDYMQDKRKGVSEIANFLSIKLSEEEIESILGKSKQLHNSKKIVKIDNFDDYKYRQTLMTQSHNSSGGKIGKFKYFFSSKQKKKLLEDKEIYEFLKKYGYE